MRLGTLGLRERGEGVRQVLGHLRGRPWAALAAGAVATAAVHSSSISTMAIVGLVHVGALDLDVAAAGIIGANIGATAPVQLLAFRAGPWLPAAIGATGLALTLTRLRTWSGPVLGFACLLGGLTLLDRAVAPLAKAPWFSAGLLLLAQHPLLGAAAGAGLSTVVLSSSLVIGVLQGFGNQGLLPLAAAIPVIVGSNVGTTTDTLLASLATGRDGRRAALFHLLFNVAGTLVALPLAGALAGTVAAAGGDPARQIANAHLLFNVLNAAWLFPLRGRLMAVTNLVVRRP